MSMDGAAVAFSRTPNALEGRLELGWGDCSLKGRCLGWGEYDFQRDVGYEGRHWFQRVAIDLKMGQL